MSKPGTEQFSLVLLFIHPSIDPQVITDELGLTALHASKRGDARATPKGTPLPGVYRDSRWNHEFTFDHDSSVSQAFHRVLQRVAGHEALFHKIASEGGEINLELDLPGGDHKGASLEPELLKRIAALNISLGIEVFPDWDSATD